VRVEIGLAEVLGGLIPHRARDVRLRDERDRLGQRQRGLLARGEDVELVPGGEEVQELGVDAVLERLVDVHVEAVRAAVDLAGAELDEVRDARLEALVDLALQGDHPLVGAGEVDRAGRAVVRGERGHASHARTRSVRSARPVPDRRSGPVRYAASRAGGLAASCAAAGSGAGRWWRGNSSASQYGHGEAVLCGVGA
jgi:hypothetical protein